MKQREATVKGIIMTGWTIPALIEGRKTQTRRIIKGVDHSYAAGDIEPLEGYDGEWFQWIDREQSASFCAPYAVGDTLYVREAIDLVNQCYVADETELDRWPKYLDTYGGHHAAREICPAIHMRRELSRLTIPRVLEVRAERIQDISEDDARAEGILAPADAVVEMICDIQKCTYRAGFVLAWEALHPGSWDRNNWAWVYRFEPAVAMNVDDWLRREAA